MKATHTFSPSRLGWPMIIWLSTCIAEAFFIPRYDLGFDGVKVWLYLCLLTLLFILCSAMLPSVLERRRHHRP